MTTKTQGIKIFMMEALQIRRTMMVTTNLMRNNMQVAKSKFKTRMDINISKTKMKKKLTKRYSRNKRSSINQSNYRKK